MPRPSLSPFTDLFETESHPHARTLRTSFLQKVEDSFYVFAGKMTNSKRPHYGIYDYITLGLPFLYKKILSRKWFPFLFLPIPLVSAPFLLSLLLSVLRYPVCIAAAIIFSPVTLVVHMASSCIGLINYEDTIKFLTRTEIDTEDLDANVTEEKPGIFRIDFRQKYTDYSTGKQRVDDRVLFTANFEVDKRNQKMFHAKNIYGLFALNIGDVVGKIEESDLIDKRLLDSVHLTVSPH